MNLSMHGNAWPGSRFMSSKIFLIMRLATFLLLACCLQIHAKGFSQRVTYSGRNVSLASVLSSIKDQTGYLFWYDARLLENAKPVNISVKDATIDEAMNICLRDQPINYKIEDNTIILSPRRLIAPALAPRQVITGVVKDEKGNPLPGVSVRIKGAQKGTSTKADGSFELDGPAGATLVFSFIGMEQKEVAAGSGEPLKVTLLAKTGALGEVVVTAFGEYRNKSTLGYSVSQVGGADILKATPINPIAALQGMVPGLQVQSGIGGPQGTTRFLIRGSASLDPYGNQPLVVVDDIIMDQDVIMPNKGSDQDMGNILKDINPDDIESISVLKGGAVTALYGSRASNGVILIKTKKGFKQKGLGVNVSADIYAATPYKTVDFQNQFGSGYGLTDFSKDANGNLKINPDTYGYNFGPEMTGQTVIDVTGKTIQNNPRPHNILDAFRTGITRNFNVGLSNGSDLGTYRLSYSNLYSEGVTPNNDMSRNNLAFRGTTKIANVLMVDANVTYVQSTAVNPANVGANYGTMKNFVYGGTRNYDTKYWMSNYIDKANGGVNQSDPSGMTSFVWFPLLENKMTQTENNFRGSIDLKADLTNHLRWQGLASINYIGTNWDNKERGQDVGFGNPKYHVSNTNKTIERYQSSLVYTNDLNAFFSLMVQAGGEVNRGIQSSMSASMESYILPDVYRLSNSRGIATVSETAPNKYQSTSGFAQAQLGYKEFLYLNLYGRNDWNSTLVYNDGHGAYSYFYPGADVSWIFTDNFKLPEAFDYGKLRASFASVGGGTTNYTANTGAYTANGSYNGVASYSYSSNTLPNQSLLPTRSHKFETGMELKFFKNRLGADITFYNQDSKAQIISFSSPIESGVSATLINGGKVRNRGWEIRLNATPIKTKNFSWDTYFNYTRNRNKVLDLPYNLDYVSLGGGDGFNVIAKKGGDYGTIIANYGYAIYNSPDGKHSENNGKRVLSMTSAKGSSVYVRAQNYNDGLTKSPAVGNITPDFLGNWRNNFNYKQWQLGFVLDSKFGGKVYSFTHDLGSWLGSMKSTIPFRNTQLGGLKFTNASGVEMETGMIIDGVYKDGTVVTGLDGASHDLSGMTMKDAYDKGWINPTNSFAYYQNTHSWGNGIRESSMFTSSWISLQQVSLTYDMPNKVAAKLKLNGLRFSVIGNNIMYLYNSAKDHVNPDNLNSSGSDAFQEVSAMPYIRNIGFQIWGSF